MGKRSSSIGGQHSRISDVNNASSRLSTNKKKSLLLQPGFSRHSRSNSVDTLNDGPLEASRYDSKMGTSMFSSAKKPMQRSKSQANLMTPCTPKNVYRPPSMALDSAKSVRSKMSLDNRERMSSMGGRVSKKDTRPINDKNFIQEMTEKAQKVANLYPDCKSLMNNGKIRPMSTQLFIMLSEIVLQYFDPKLNLNNGNYAHEIPITAKLFLYKGKLDKTMLITVSTPHTYPNVIAFLAWFVECREMAQALDFELLFNEISNGSADIDDEEDEMDFAVLVPYLAKVYNFERKKKSCDHLTEDLRHELRQRALKEYKPDEEEDNELINMYEQLEAENDAKNRELQEVDNEYAMVIKTKQEQDRYLSDMEEFLNSIDQQQILVEQQLQITEDKNTSTSNDMQSILLTVKNQELSLEDKEKLAMERSEIMREMNLVEAQIKQCNDILYNEQMELSKHKNKVDACIVKYNSDLYEHLNSMPDAQKELAIDINVLDPEASDQHTRVSNLLDSLLGRLEVKPEELEDRLASVQSDVMKQEGDLKAISDQLASDNERMNLLNAQDEEKRAHFELELQALEAEVKRVDREVQMISVKKPNVLDVEKRLAQKKLELEEFQQMKTKYFGRMKRRILALDNAYKEKVLTAEASQKIITAKRNELQTIMNRK